MLKWYIATLISAVVGLSLVSGLAVAEFAAYFTNHTDRNILQPYRDLKPQQAFKDANFKVLYQTVPHEVWLTVVAFTFTLGSLAALAVLRLLCIHIYLMRHNTSTYTDIDEESLSISEAYTPQKVDSYTSGATLNSVSFTIELVTDLPWVSTVQTTRSAKKNNNHCKLVVVNETCPCCDQPDNSSGCSLEVVSLATCSGDL